MRPSRSSPEPGLSSSLRLAIYFSITLAYLVATGAGAGVGYGVGHIWSDPEGPAGFALGGGIIGFGLVSVAIYWLREYLLYMVKAGHIAAMVHIIDRLPLPGGQGQIAYARTVVERRFAEANALSCSTSLSRARLQPLPDFS